MNAESSPVPGFTDEQAAPLPPPGRAASSPRPPLTMRIRRIHWVTLDCFLAAVCAVTIFLVLYKGGRVDQPPVTAWHARDWIPPVLAICLSIPVAIRRRDPVLSLGLVLVASAAVLFLAARITRGPFLPLALVLYTVAVTRGRRTALAALAAALTLCAVQGVLMHLDGSGAGNVIAVGLVLVIVWLIGYSVRQRRAYAARLQQQTADSAVTAERLRIARELHDVVAHSMTVVAVQAGFGEYVFDRQPAEARAALAAIQTMTREALADMQRMLGALRQAGPADVAPAATETLAGPRAPAAAAPLAPTAGLADLDRLVAGTAGAGVRVEVLQTGQTGAIPAAIDLSAFRIVQEALTNVVKHSGADRCRVAIGYGPDGLRVEITDPGQARALAMAGAPTRTSRLAPGTGHGIAGMRERVSLCGGEFTAGPLPGQGFRVAARLPLPGGA